MRLALVFLSLAGTLFSLGAGQKDSGSKVPTGSSFASTVDVLRNVQKILLKLGRPLHSPSSIKGSKVQDDGEETDGAAAEPNQYESLTNGFGAILAEGLIGGILAPQTGDIRDFIGSLTQNVLRTVALSLTTTSTRPPPTTTPTLPPRRRPPSFIGGGSGGGVSNGGLPLDQFQRFPPNRNQAVVQQQQQPSFSHVLPGRHPPPRDPYEKAPPGQSLPPIYPFELDSHQTEESSSSSLQVGSTSPPNNPSIHYNYPSPVLVGPGGHHSSSSSGNTPESPLPGGIVGNLFRGVVKGVAGEFGLVSSSTSTPLLSHPQPQTVTQEQLAPIIYILQSSLPNRNSTTTGGVGGNGQQTSPAELEPAVAKEEDEDEEEDI